MRASAVILLAASATALAASGCLVQSRCQSDYDCEGRQVCGAAGDCYLECVTHNDCLTKGMICLDNRCEITGDRIKAQNFCLKVVNKSAKSYYGKQLCLEALEGKVVLIYFGATVA
jgi:hypothetical protein